MNKFLKSWLRILLAILAIILLAWLVWAWINRDSRAYDIDYDLVLFITLFIGLFIVYFILIYKTFKPQKWTKRMLIFVLSLIFVFVLYMAFSVILWLKVTKDLPVDRYRWDIVQIISIILSIYLVMLIKVHRTDDLKRKKRLKTIIRVILPFMLMGVRAWLTKAWAISNRFNIDSLNPQESRFDYYMNYRCYDSWDSEWGGAACLDKPIIYIYPTQETEVNVTLWTPKNLSHTYPKYNNEKWWNVVAQPNGDLEDMETWRKLYALYREWKTYGEDNFTEWFVVKWEDTISFLEEKLALLWLNEREAEEFIIYWLPQMEDNKYNLIRFETKEEQDENMPLNIIPTPDTVIRVMMDWKAIEELIDIPEQELVTPERTWFTVVEWWGSPRN